MPAYMCVKLVCACGACVCVRLIVCLSSVCLPVRSVGLCGHKCCQVGPPGAMLPLVVGVLVQLVTLILAPLVAYVSMFLWYDLVTIAHAYCKHDAAQRPE